MTLPTVTMQAPAGGVNWVYGASGTKYVSDSNGVVSGVLSSDVASLQQGGFVQIATTFAGFNIPLTSGKNTDGSSLAAAAAAGKFGMTITLGTASELISQAANSSTITNSVIWELTMPASMPQNYNPTITANAGLVITTGGTLSTKTLAIHAYPVSNSGSQAADIVTTAAQVVPTVAGDLVFATAGLNAVDPGTRLVVEAVMTLIETAGTNAVGHLNSVRLS